MKKAKSSLLLLMTVVVAVLCLSQNVISDTEGLVFYLSFEDAGNPVDHSPDPAQVEVKGRLKKVDGKIGKALEFDGNVANHIEVAHKNKLEGMTALTIEVWVKPDAPDAVAKGIVSKRVSFNNNDSYNLFLWNEVKIWGRINANQDQQISSETVIEDGKWYHLAYVFDGNEAESDRQKLYIDGVLESTQAHPDKAVPEFGTSLWIGALNEGSSPWRGIIDEVRIWARALSDDEIVLAMTGDIMPVQPHGSMIDTWGRIKRN